MTPWITLPTECSWLYTTLWFTEEDSSGSNSTTSFALWSPTPNGSTWTGDTHPWTRKESCSRTSNLKTKMKDSQINFIIICQQLWENGKTLIIRPWLKFPPAEVVDWITSPDIWTLKRLMESISAKFRSTIAEISTRTIRSSPLWMATLWNCQRSRNFKLRKSTLLSMLKVAIAIPILRDSLRKSKKSWPQEAALLTLILDLPTNGKRSKNNSPAQDWKLFIKKIFQTTLCTPSSLMKKENGSSLRTNWVPSLNSSSSKLVVLRVAISITASKNVIWCQWLMCCKSQWKIEKERK